MIEIITHRGNALNDALQIKVLDNPGASGAPRIYEIQTESPGAVPLVNRLRFHAGPLDRGPDGISNEALLAIVIHRLEGFQDGPFKCKDNKDALGMIKGGLTCLQKRTKVRAAQGVEGNPEPHVETPPVLVGPMKVYRLNEYEWWMAHSLEEAVEVAMKETGAKREDVLDENFAKELTDEQLDKLQYEDQEPDTPVPEGGWPMRSFREELAASVARGDGPGIFAGHES